LNASWNRQRLQREIAVVAARRMAEVGDDCAQAKRKAAAEIMADAGRARGVLPDNEQVEAALREYQRTFDAAAHRLRLHRLRSLALEWMQRLEGFRPHLVGAVLNGSATKFCPLRLNLYTESAKDVEMALLDRGVDIRVDTAGGEDLHAQEAIGFLAEPATRAGTGVPAAVLLTVYDPAALRIAPGARARAADPLLHPIERSGRASLSMVRQLLAETSGSTAPSANHV